MYTINDTLDDFTRPTAAGQTFRLSEYRGQQVLMIFLRHLA
jgi:peroxiredoxin